MSSKLNALVAALEAIDNKELEITVTEAERNLRSAVSRATVEQNITVGDARKVPITAALKVVDRYISENLAAEDPRDWMFFAAREVAHFLDYAQSGTHSAIASKYTDLLPVGHPDSTNSALNFMSDPAVLRASAAWFASDDRIAPEAYDAVFNAFATIPGTTDHQFATARLRALPAGLVPSELVIKPIVAAFGIGNPFAGGNSSAARSARARAQRRDSKGRFAEMGGGARFSGLFDGFGQSITGKIAGVPQNSNDIEIEVLNHPRLPNGIYPINANGVEGVKAVLRRTDRTGKEISIPVTDRRALATAVPEADLLATRKDAPTGWNKNPDGSYTSDDGYSVSMADGMQIDSRFQGGGVNGAYDPSLPVYKLADENGETVAFTQGWADIQKAAAKNDESTGKSPVKARLRAAQNQPRDAKNRFTEPKKPAGFAQSAADPYEGLTPEEAGKLWADKHFAEVRDYQAFDGDFAKDYSSDNYNAAELQKEYSDGEFDSLKGYSPEESKAFSDAVAARLEEHNENVYDRMNERSTDPDRYEGYRDIDQYDGVSGWDQDDADEDILKQAQQDYYEELAGELKSKGITPAGFDQSSGAKPYDWRSGKSDEERISAAKSAIEDALAVGDEYALDDIYVDGGGGEGRASREIKYLVNEALEEMEIARSEGEYGDEEDEEGFDQAAGGKMDEPATDLQYDYVKNILDEQGSRFPADLRDSMQKATSDRNLTKGEIGEIIGRMTPLIDKTIPSSKQLASIRRNVIAKGLSAREANKIIKDLPTMKKADASKILDRLKGLKDTGDFVDESPNLVGKADGFDVLYTPRKDGKWDATAVSTANGAQLDETRIVDSPAEDLKNYDGVAVADFPGQDDGEPAGFAQSAPKPYDWRSGNSDEDRIKAARRAIDDAIEFGDTDALDDIYLDGGGGEGRASSEIKYMVDDAYEQIDEMRADGEYGDEEDEEGFDQSAGDDLANDPDMKFMVDEEANGYGEITGGPIRSGSSDLSWTFGPDDEITITRQTDKDGNTKYYASVVGEVYPATRYEPADYDVVREEEFDTLQDAFETGQSWTGDGWMPDEPEYDPGFEQAAGEDTLPEWEPDAKAFNDAVNELEKFNLGFGKEGEPSTRTFTSSDGRVKVSVTESSFWDDGDEDKMASIRDYIDYSVEVDGQKVPTTNRASVIKAIAQGLDPNRSEKEQKISEIKKKQFAEMQEASARLRAEKDERIKKLDKYNLLSGDDNPAINDLFTSIEGYGSTVEGDGYTASSYFDYDNDQANWYLEFDDGTAFQGTLPLSQEDGIDMSPGDMSAEIYSEIESALSNIDDQKQRELKQQGGFAQSAGDIDQDLADAAGIGKPLDGVWDINVPRSDDQIEIARYKAADGSTRYSVNDWGPRGQGSEMTEPNFQRDYSSLSEALKDPSIDMYPEGYIDIDHASNPKNWKNDTYTSPDGRLSIEFESDADADEDGRTIDLSSLRATYDGRLLDEDVVRDYLRDVRSGLDTDNPYATDVSRKSDLSQAIKGIADLAYNEYFEDNKDGGFNQKPARNEAVENAIESGDLDAISEALNDPANAAYYGRLQDAYYDREGEYLAEQFEGGFGQAAPGGAMDDPATDAQYNFIKSVLDQQGSSLPADLRDAMEEAGNNRNLTKGEIGAIIGEMNKNIDKTRPSDKQLASIRRNVIAKGLPKKEADKIIKDLPKMKKEDASKLLDRLKGMDDTGDFRDASPSIIAKGDGFEVKYTPRADGKWDATPVDREGGDIGKTQVVDSPEKDFADNYAGLSAADFPGASDGEPAGFAQEAGTEPSSELGRFIIDQLMPLEMKEGADSSNAENSSWVIKDTLDRIAKFVDENEGDPDLAAKVEDRFMPFGFKNTSGTSDEDLPPSAWWQRGAVLDAARLISKNSKTGFDQKPAESLDNIKKLVDGPKNKAAKDKLDAIRNSAPSEAGFDQRTSDREDVALQTNGTVARADADGADSVFDWASEWTDFSVNQGENRLSEWWKYTEEFAQWKTENDPYAADAGYVDVQALNEALVRPDAWTDNGDGSFSYSGQHLNEGGGPTIEIKPKANEDGTFNYDIVNGRTEDIIDTIEDVPSAADARELLSPAGRGDTFFTDLSQLGYEVSGADSNYDNLFRGYGFNQSAGFNQKSASMPEYLEEDPSKIRLVPKSGRGEADSYVGADGSTGELVDSVVDEGTPKERERYTATLRDKDGNVVAEKSFVESDKTSAAGASAEWLTRRIADYNKDQNKEATGGFSAKQMEPATPAQYDMLQEQFDEREFDANTAQAIEEALANKNLTKAQMSTLIGQGNDASFKPGIDPTKPSDRQIKSLTNKLMTKDIDAAERDQFLSDLPNMNRDEVEALNNRLRSKKDIPGTAGFAQEAGDSGAGDISARSADLNDRLNEFAKSNEIEYLISNDELNEMFDSRQYGPLDEKYFIDTLRDMAKTVRDRNGDEKLAQDLDDFAKDMDQKFVDDNGPIEAARWEDGVDSKINIDDIEEDVQNHIDTYFSDSPSVVRDMLERNGFYGDNRSGGAGGNVRQEGDKYVANFEDSETDMQELGSYDSESDAIDALTDAITDWNADRSEFAFQLRDNTNGRLAEEAERLKNDPLAFADRLEELSGLMSNTRGGGNAADKQSFDWADNIRRQAERRNQEGGFSQEAGTDAKPLSPKMGEPATDAQYGYIEELLGNKAGITTDLRQATLDALEGRNLTKAQMGAIIGQLRALEFNPDFDPTKPTKRQINRAKDLAAALNLSPKERRELGLTRLNSMSPDEIGKLIDKLKRRGERGDSGEGSGGVRPKAPTRPSGGPGRGANQDGFDQAAAKKVAKPKLPKAGLLSGKSKYTDPDTGKTYSAGQYIEADLSSEIDTDFSDNPLPDESEFYPYSDDLLDESKVPLQYTGLNLSDITGKEKDKNKPLFLLRSEVAPEAAVVRENSNGIPYEERGQQVNEDGQTKQNYYDMYSETAGWEPLWRPQVESTGYYIRDEEGIFESVAKFEHGSESDSPSSLNIFDWEDETAEYDLTDFYEKKEPGYAARKEQERKESAARYEAYLKERKAEEAAAAARPAKSSKPVSTDKGVVVDGKTLAKNDQVTVDLNVDWKIIQDEVSTYDQREMFRDPNISATYQGVNLSDYTGREGDAAIGLYYISEPWELPYDGIPEYLEDDDGNVIEDENGNTTENPEFLGYYPIVERGYYFLSEEDILNPDGLFDHSRLATRRSRENLDNLQKMSSEESSAVRKYTTSANYINSDLRSGEKLSKESQDSVNALDKVIDRATRTSPVVVYRGVSISEAGRKKFESSLKVGKIFTDPAYLSTAEDQSKIGVFSDPSMAGGITVSGRTPYIFTIRVPKGAKAYTVGPGLSRYDEKEILLPRGSKFKVTKVDFPNVEMEMIPNDDTAGFAQEAGLPQIPGFAENDSTIFNPAWGTDGFAQGTPKERSVTPQSISRILANAGVTKSASYKAGRKRQGYRASEGFQVSTDSDGNVTVNYRQRMGSDIPYSRFNETTRLPALEKIKNALEEKGFVLTEKDEGGFKVTRIGDAFEQSVLDIPRVSETVDSPKAAEKIASDAIDANKKAEADLLGRIKDIIRGGAGSWSPNFDVRRGETRDDDVVTSNSAPINPVSGHAYSASNFFELAAAGNERGYSDRRWMTYLQAEKAGAKIRSGEQGVEILVPVEREVKYRDPKTGEAKTRRVIEMKKQYVFNAEQMDGLGPDTAPRNTGLAAGESIDHMLARFGQAQLIRDGRDIPRINIGGGSGPRWIPAASGQNDSIRLPDRSMFESPEALVNSLTHEIVHGAGFQDRLDRYSNRKGLQGDKRQIALEELTAELGSAILMQRMGVPYDTKKHAAYVDSHIRAENLSEEDLNFAFAEGQIAADYILGNDVLPRWDNFTTDFAAVPTGYRPKAPRSWNPDPELSSAEAPSAYPPGSPGSDENPMAAFAQAAAKKFSGKANKDSQSALDKVTEQLLEKIKTGAVPWRKPFKGIAGANLQRNPASKHIYTGVNQQVLSIMQLIRGYSDPRWMTYKQAETMGGQVRKGEKAVYILVPMRVNTEDATTGEESSFVMFRAAAVFNVEQIDGLELPTLESEGSKLNDFTPVEAHEFIVERYEKAMTARTGNPVKITYRDMSDQEAPHWNPGSDRIVLPNQGQFNSPEELFDTLTHEMVHSTGHADRLDRTELGKDYGKPDGVARAKEELIAEIGSALIADMFGVDSSFDNTAAYVQSWLQRLKSHPEEVIQASKEAQKAVDYILGTDLGDWSPLDGYGPGLGVVPKKEEEENG